MRIRTKITFKIDGHPKYNNEIGMITDIQDNAFDIGASEQFFKDFTDSFRVAMADASCEVTTDLIDALRNIAKERETK